VLGLLSVKIVVHSYPSYFHNKKMAGKCREVADTRKHTAPDLETSRMETFKLQTAHRKARGSNQPLLTSQSSRRPATPIALC